MSSNQRRRIRISRSVSVFVAYVAGGAILGFLGLPERLWWLAMVLMIPVALWVGSLGKRRDTS